MWVMSRDNSAGTARGGEEEAGPGTLFMPFVVMEDLLDKLKLLHYETEFVSELRMRPLNRHYFVLQTNPGEQFFLFTSLAAWLVSTKIFYILHKHTMYFTIGQVRKAGVEMEQPQEFDDPNTTISNILDRLRRFGVTIDFAPSKLKQGYGEQALFVLDRLSDEALRATQFTWSQPEAPEEEAKEDEEMEDDAEVLLDRVEEDMAGETSDEEEEDILHIDDFKNYHQNKVDRYHY